MPGFGTSLPARLPACSGSDIKFISPSGNDTTGDGSIGNPWLTPDKALDNISLTGGLIYCRGGTYTTGTPGDPSYIQWGRTGSTSDPVQMRAYAAELPVFQDMKFEFASAGIGFRLGPGIEINGPQSSEPCVKVTGTSHDVEIVGLILRASQDGHGFLVTESPGPITNVQLWDCIIYDNGSTTLDHGIYWSGGTSGNVIANCLLYDPNSGYNIQLYPDCDNLIGTCLTLDGGTSRGGFIIGNDPTGETTTGTKIYGAICTNAAYYAVNEYNTTGSADNDVYDSVSYNNASGDFETNPGGLDATNCITGQDPLYADSGSANYRLKSGTPAANLIPTTRADYIPPVDIVGIPRRTRTPGAYAFPQGRQVSMTGCG